MFLSLSFSLPSLLSKIKILRINNQGALLAFSESCGHRTLSLKVLSLSRAPQTPVPATLSFITRPGVLLSLLFKCSLRFLFLVPLAAFGRTPGRKRGSNFEQPPSHQTFFRPVVAQPRVYWTPVRSAVYTSGFAPSDCFLSLFPLVVAGFSTRMCIRGKLSISRIPLRSRFQDRITRTRVRKTGEDVGGGLGSVSPRCSLDLEWLREGEQVG